VTTYPEWKGGQKRETMQRVRIGLTGLAVVFLLVLLGTMIRSVSSDEPASANLAGLSSAGDAAMNGQQPTEPLAELGVAPGSTESENAAISSSGVNKK
jgi:hypothetical protein